MTELIFSTGNNQKFSMGQHACSEYDITLIKNELDIDEVQSEDIEYVARRKAEVAFSLVKQPVIISDDAWHIFALNGFPGTYAKSVNTWFSGDDYLRLTRDLEDRRIALVQSLVYQDEHAQQFFKKETIGTLLTESKGTAGVALQKIVSFEKDGKSISEMMGDKAYYAGAEALKVWHKFAKWYTEKNT
jgi:non-canonical purine NTP pyrophosphatase (RdgB/HAM1 family)